MNVKRRTLSWVAAAGCVAALGVPATLAHETDQFLMPERQSDVEFADLGRYFSDYFGQAIEDAVAATNVKIDRAERGVKTEAQAVRVGRKGRMAVRRDASGASLEELRSSMGIAAAVRRQLPDALTLIDSLEWNPPDMTRYGYSADAVVIYKPHSDNAMHTDLHFILDPRIVGRLWRTGTFQAYGSYMGADKLGHFVDMGYRYYKVYDGKRSRGAGPQEASEAAIKFGVDDGLIGENALLGRLTAGAYSNADLASNYVGMLFYRNLTEPVLLQGERRPPMLELDERGRWKVAEHVATDPDFFRWFLSDHYNEALNPSHFERGMQPKVKKAIAQRWDRVAAWYPAQHQQWFADRAVELMSYHGQPYGHCRVWDELYHLGNVDPVRDGDLVDDTPQADADAALALDR